MESKQFPVMWMQTPGPNFFLLSFLKRNFKVAYEQGCSDPGSRANPDRFRKYYKDPDSDPNRISPI